MTAWFTSTATTPCQRYPETIFVRWVTDHYRFAHRAVRFLELGSGSGADLRFLMVCGFDALGVDSAPEAYANIHCDFADIPWNQLGQFDCIYELNVLCCVENPPYKEIAAALKPGGKFFAIMPDKYTETDFSGLKERGITVRGFTPFSIRKSLDGIFSNISVRRYEYPAHGLQHINWVVEATK